MKIADEIEDVSLLSTKKPLLDFMIWFMIYEYEQLCVTPNAARTTTQENTFYQL